MRKYNKYKLLGLAFLAVVIASCDTASQEVADVVSAAENAVATFVADTSGAAFAEGDTIRYLITLDKPLDHDVSFSVSVTGGTADASDFEVINAVIDAYSLSDTLKFVLIMDDDAEAEETVQLEIGANSLATKHLLNPSIVNPTMDFTIANWHSNKLEMSFSWDIDVELDPNLPKPNDEYRKTVHAGGEMDFDIFLGDWSVYGATGDEPEVMDFEGLADGTYVIWCELWANSLTDTALAQDGYGVDVELLDVPINAHFMQSGVQEVTLEQDTSQVFTTHSLGYKDDEYAGENIDTYVASVDVTTVDGLTTYVIRNDPADILKSLPAGNVLKLPARPTSAFR